MTPVFTHVPGAYNVSFKRRRSGKLLNILVEDCKDEVEAARVATQRVVQDGRKGYREYGISRHYLHLYPCRSWGMDGERIDWRVGGPEVWRSVVKTEYVT